MIPSHDFASDDVSIKSIIEQSVEYVEQTDDDEQGQTASSRGQSENGLTLHRDDSNSTGAATTVFPIAAFNGLATSQSKGRVGNMNRTSRNSNNQLRVSRRPSENGPLVHYHQ